MGTTHTVRTMTSMRRRGIFRMTRMLIMRMRMKIADDENAGRPSTVSEGFNRGDARLEERQPECHLFKELSTVGQ